jgi:thiol-disulfide isomerase/thioredoxin
MALAMAVSFLATPLLQAATLPRKAPEFTVFLPNKAQMPLNTYKGKTVVLAFISHDCSHCQSFTRVLNRVQKDYASQGLQGSNPRSEEGRARHARVRPFSPAAFPVGFNLQRRGRVPAASTETVPCRRGLHR